MTNIRLLRGYYMKKESTIKKIVGSSMAALLLLIPLSSVALGDRAFTIRVETDQTQYSPGDQVVVTIQLLKNGQGYPAGICPEILDSNQNMIYGGLCYDSDSQGYHNITDFYLDSNAPLGTYTVSVHMYVDDWEGLTNVTFEVVSHCGDVNNDGVVAVGDVVYLINYLYRGGPAPFPDICSGDCNGDTIVNVGDVVSLINYLYRGGSAPGGCCERNN
jgi:protein involved in polysaccharide export with SLBB domain